MLIAKHKSDLLVYFWSLCGMRMGMGRNGNEHLGNPMEMGICHNIGNGNGKEWELIAREWEGLGLSKTIPGHL
jgi:hypothetical protein